MELIFLRKLISGNHQLHSDDDTTDTLDFLIRKHFMELAELASYQCDCILLFWLCRAPSFGIQKVGDLRAQKNAHNDGRNFGRSADDSCCAQEGLCHTGFTKIPDLLDLDGDDTIWNDECSENPQDSVELANVENRHIDV